MLGAQKNKIILWFLGAFLVLAAGVLVYLASIPAYSAEPADISNLNPDEYFMARAFAEIGRSRPEDGYPVGAVVVRDGQIIGRGRNSIFQSNDPVQHAESLAIDDAVRYIHKNYPEESYPDFFKSATVYVTLEPCPMDAGKLTLLRFAKTFYCDTDEEWGASGDVSGFPHAVNFATSSLPICQTLRERPGWNMPELWEYGRSYARALNRVPSKLEVWKQKLANILKLNE